MKANGPRLGLDECDNDSERVFIEALNDRAERGKWYGDGWLVFPDRVIVTVSLSDAETNCLVRCLRVDFTGKMLLTRDRASDQITECLQPGDPGVIATSGTDPAALAAQAADWLEAESKRPIIRRDWNRPEGQVCEWVLSDTGESLSCRGLYCAGLQEVRPDRVVTIRLG